MKVVAPSESIRPHRCSLADWHNFTKMRSRFYGAGEPCLCRPICWDRILPLCLGELGTRGVRPSCPEWTIGTACGGKNPGCGGIESGVGRDKWRWAYVKAYEQVCIYRAFWNIPGNKNRFESLGLPVVSMPHITAVQRSNNLNIIYYSFYYQVLDIHDHDDYSFYIMYLWSWHMNCICWNDMN